MLRSAVLALLLLAVTPWIARPVAAQEREHTVRSGQSLGRIAHRYHVRIQDLAAANDLRVTASLREGQVLRVPLAGYHYVRTGETLSLIARRREVSVRELARANHLREDATLQVGQRLLLPGQVAVEERDAAASRWGRPRHPGVLKLVRPATHEDLRLRVLDRRGRPTRNARRRLAWLFRHRRTNLQHEPDARLLQILVRISDHFGGREIHVLSGFRPPGGRTEESSHHTDGTAVDIRIRGVRNRDLRDFCRTLPQVGCGYYPNSSFVHVDARARSAYWVDRSGPGESADYVRDRAARERVDDEDEPDAEESAQIDDEAAEDDAEAREG